MKHYLLFFCLLFLSFSVSAQDTNSPVIELNSPDTVYLQVYTSYKEPGYSAVDDIDGDITDSVQINSNLDTSTLGIYIIEYFVADNAGNNDLQVRVVIVIDTIPPNLVLNGDSLVRLAVGQVFIDTGFVVTDNYYANQEVTVIVSGDYVETVGKGCYYVCYQAEDPSGNKSKWVTRIIEVNNGCQNYDYNRCHPTPPTRPAGFGDQNLSGVKTYPNPASKEIIMEGLNNYKEVWMEFFNLEGKILSRAEITGKSIVGIPSCLSSGIYLMRITADGKTLVRRQVIE